MRSSPIDPKPGSRGPGAGAAIRLRDALRILAGTFLLILPANCARPGIPPGGPRDLLPPQVVFTDPDTFAVLDEAIESVRLEFNERISERPSQGTMDQTVLVSPETGEIEVKPGRSSIEVKMAGGFQPGSVYRITVLPQIQDMFQNAMADAFEFVFSIGSEFEEGVLAGEVVDRITGETVPGARVVAKRGTPGDSTDPGYVAVADSIGIYAIRYMPAGDWRIEAYVDQNRNRQADFAEPIGVDSQALVANDTSLVSLTILRPDTTAAQVLSVEVIDSVTIQVNLDDYLAEEAPIEDLTIELMNDSLGGMVGGRILRAKEYDLRVRRVEALARLEEDTTGAPQPSIDSLVPDTIRALPAREIYVVLPDTLITEAPYGVFVAGIININGIPGGGGTDTIVRQAPPPDSAAADSTAADSTSADSTAVDTSSVDTASVDTAAVVDTTSSDTTTARPAAPDTAGPDTTGTVAPDTGGVAHPSRSRRLLRRRR
jgi:hypothetical protein